MPKVVFHDAEGLRQEADIDVTVYREAADNGMSVPQFLNQKFPTAPETYGTAFEQIMASCGRFVARNNEYGIKPPSMKAIFEGSVELNAAGLVTREASPASRIIFPAVTLEAVENKLREDTGSYVSLFDSLVSRSDTITGYKFDQPVLDFSGPEAGRIQPIAQGATPHTMMTIKASDVSRKIPTYSLGMEITKEAQEATSLDLVTLALTRQAEIQRAVIVDEAIQAIYGGDVDAGYTALAAVKANTFDTAIVANGTLTHKAWVKWLRKNYRKRQIDWVFCDLDTALAIEGRTGKPTVQSDDPNSPRIDALAQVQNPAWQNVRIFLLEDGLLPANTILGIDSRYAIWKVSSSSADYSAVEEFVLRKSTALRFDMGYQYYRQFDEAFEVLSLTI
jgi:hypothetical protein